MIKAYNYFSAYNIFILPSFKLDLPSSKIASNSNKILPSIIADCEIFDLRRTGWRVEKSNTLENNAPPVFRRGQPFIFGNSG
jgi:hypothetical protein